MTTEEKQRTLFVGIDVHKDTHTAVGVSPFGEKLFTEYATYFKDPFALKALRHWVRVKPPCDPYLLRSLKRKAKRMLELHVTIKELEKDMQGVIDGEKYTLPTASGCGVVLAATMIGEIGDINRFKSPASLAKYAGCAPREHSSGKTVRYRKTKSGNRRLNCAFHRMALSQISPTGNDAARTYFKKKVSEGKTKSQALVCLRRHMVTVCYMMLKHGTEYRLPAQAGCPQVTIG